MRIATVVLLMAKYNNSRMQLKITRMLSNWTLTIFKLFTIKAMSIYN